jgi:tetratricopeptide (TPR) repeat protein
MGALRLVKAARQLLLQAEALDPKALDGSVYTSLGSLYYQVPGWPIGFGDKKQAVIYLHKALELNPDGIDPNYFYGDFLVEQGDYRAAVPVLEKALKAPPRPGREIADRGRREEVRRTLQKARDKGGRS